MMALDTHDKFIIDLYQQAQRCMVPEFCEYAFVALKKIVHFDSAAVADCTIDAHRQFAMQTVQLHATTLARFHHRSELLGKETQGADGAVNSRDVLLKSAFSHRGKSAIVDIANSFSDPDVLEYCRKFDTAHALAFIDEAITESGFSAASLWRADPRRPFDEAEGDTTSRLLPHLLLARRICQRLNAKVITSFATTMLSSAEGQLYFVTQQAIDLLRLEWVQWSSPALPQQLMMSLRESGNNLFIGRSITVQSAKEGQVLSLKITRNTPPGGLTHAEWRVATLAMQGSSYKEIGKQLAVSPATVRNHLHAVYVKLEVTNKTAMTAAVRFISTQNGTDVP